MDPQNKYTAISRTALERIDPNKIYTGHGDCNDILVRLNTYGFRAVNVSYPLRYTLGETPGKRCNLYVLFKEFLWRMKEKYLILNFHPLVFFYFFGIVCVVTSLFLGIYALYEKIVGMEPLFIRAALALILLFIGSMLILFAMLFDMEQERNIGIF